MWTLLIYRQIDIEHIEKHLNVFWSKRQSFIFLRLKWIFRSHCPIAKLWCVGVAHCFNIIKISCHSNSCDDNRTATVTATTATKFWMFIILTSISKLEIMPLDEPHSVAIIKLFSIYVGRMELIKFAITVIALFSSIERNFQWSKGRDKRKKWTWKSGLLTAWIGDTDTDMHLYQYSYVFIVCIGEYSMPKLPCWFYIRHQYALHFLHVTWLNGTFSVLFFVFWPRTKTPPDRYNEVAHTSRIAWLPC